MMQEQQYEPVTPLGEPIAAAAPSAAADVYAPVAKGDKHLWGIYILLCFISVIELYSASSREVAGAGLGVFGPIVRHGFMLLCGFFIILYLQRTHYRKILKAIPLFVFISIVMMLYTIFFGDVINGARRSFRILGQSIQPSEFLKISAAMMVALIMARTQVKGGGVRRVGIIASAAFILFFCGMLAPQGLTNTLLLMSISGSMMLIGGIGLKRFGLVMLVYGCCFGLYLGVTHLRENKKDKTEKVVTADSGVSAAELAEMQSLDDRPKEEKSRMGVWSDRLGNYFGGGVPKYEVPLTSDNRQEQLGYMAQAHGGLTGVGPGNSRETSRLPLAFTDYVFSIIVEELGLIGGIIVLVLYLWLLTRASAIASRCSRAFPALLVIGMALTIVFQALFHICIVTGVIPVSGQPLPLISKGGSSILVTSIAFGIMLSVSRFAVRNSAKNKEIKQEIEALPEEMRAENPTQL